MTTFLLVHGGLHGGWCWEEVVPLLEAEGHSALAPDLPGMGSDPTPLAEVDLKLCADKIASIIADEAGPVLLVGHSMGGITISEVAERVPEGLLGLVYVSARLIPNGQSMADARSSEIASRPGLIVSDDGLSTTYEPAEAAAIFYNGTPPDKIARIMPRLTPQPILPTTERLRLTPERFGRVPRAYIECLRDNSNPLSHQRAMQDALPCDLTITMDNDHSPFYSAPEALAANLMNIATHFSRRKSV
ncbi:MAG: alpha/beta fold hydrolase [Sphingomonadales bacterium]|nr:MAG: alpha/beta fold hydrolase [Sphingomonadales bacterium]